MKEGDFGYMSFTKRFKRECSIKDEPQYMDWGYVIPGEIIEVADEYVRLVETDTPKVIHKIDKNRIRDFKPCKRK